MTAVIPPKASNDLPELPQWRRRAAILLQEALEGLVLVLVVLSPWVFGAVDPGYEALLYGGVGLLLALWGARLLLEGRVVWQRCPLAVGLAALFVCGACQLAPLPESVLARLSPATARLYGRLLPESPERLPAAEVRDAAPVPAPGSTISVYPHGTRTELVRLLAVFLVFAIVRNNIASAASMRRLSLAALANGALLSLLGILQFFTSPPNTIYWTDSTRGMVFGPFINRDHFAFYVNVCVGLGVGLLLARSVHAEEGRDSGAGKSGFGRNRSGAATTPGLLHDPQALWIILALALMVTGVVFCLSRGGFLALLGGAVVCLTIKFSRSRRFLRLEAALLTLALVLTLLAWFGLERVEARLATLWGGEGLKDDRVSLLLRSPPLVKDFPLWGTGYGTFAVVEPLYRHNPIDAGWTFVHAHNEYLEALIEGGLVRFILSVVIIGLVFRLGYRAFCRHEGQPAGGLALGAVFGFTTLVIHSFVDFGFHIPAIALLATVLCAQLGALGAAGRDIGHDPAGAQGAGGEGYSFRLWGQAPVLGAATLLVLGLALCAEGWKKNQIHQLVRAAPRTEEIPAPGELDRRIAYLEAATRLDPSNARLHYDLGEAHSDRYEDQAKRLENRDRPAAAALAVSQPALGRLAASVAGAPWTSTASWTVGAKIRDSQRKELVAQLARRHLVPALRHYLQARDLCALRAKPHLRIAAYVRSLGSADPRTSYLERAQLLDPSDPELWYRCGIHELRDGQPERAWRSWRRSLELSDHYLSEVLDRSRVVLTPRDILENLLPDNAGLLLRSATHLYPGSDALAEQKPFLVKALMLLEDQPTALTADDFHVKAVIYTSLGQPTEALAAYQGALVREPQHIDWRYQFAKLLYEQGQFREARHELLTVLAQQPGHAPARELLDTVTRELAKRL